MLLYNRVPWYAWSRILRFNPVFGILSSNHLFEKLLSTSLLFRRSERFSHKLCFPLVDTKLYTYTEITILLTQKKKGVGGISWLAMYRFICQWNSWPTSLNRKPLPYNQNWISFIPFFHKYWVTITSQYFQCWKYSNESKYLHSKKPDITVRKTMKNACTVW